jgi:hypothetical protein
MPAPVSRPDRRLTKTPGLPYPDTLPTFDMIKAARKAHTIPNTIEIFTGFDAVGGITIFR